MQQDFLTNHFLIAMPNMEDPNFDRTVTFICEHTENGAVGIVINRQSEYTLRFILEQMQIHSDIESVLDHPVLIGGPLQPERGFVVHKPEGQWRSSIQLGDDIAVTTSHDVLEAIAVGEGPEQFLIALGYAGWDKHQLDLEIRGNTWLSCPKDDDILFTMPFKQRWDAAAKLIGVDMKFFTGDSGHA